MCIWLACHVFFFFKQKTAYEMRISDWSSDVCSSDLDITFDLVPAGAAELGGPVGRRPAARVEDALPGQRHVGIDEDARRACRRQANIVGQMRRQKGANLVAKDRKSTRLNSSH